jgi:UDPglucose 6-dehydrogenase
MGILKNKTIAILGLSFKPNTDDIREAPSLNIIRRLQEENAKVRAYDPVSMKVTQSIFPDITYCKDPYDAVKGANALVIVTEWNQFRNLELDRLKKLLREPYFFDLRNIYDPQKLKHKGFNYSCVGRSSKMLE